MQKKFEIPLGVKIKNLFPDKTLPLLIEPSGEISFDFDSFRDWFIENKEWIQNHLFNAGSLLFRNFPIDTSDKFEYIVKSYDSNLLNYVGGNSPRDLVSNKVYTSTSYPPNWKITLHNELSYLLNYPKVLFFYCAIPPKSGGETPVADARTFLKNLDVDIKGKFINKKIKYVQNFYDGVLGKSWKKTFETEDKSFVEDFCKKENAEFYWDEKDNLKIIYYRDAIIKHPVTGEDVWFNQADQWHSSSLDEKARNFLLKKMNSDELPHNSFYSDGSIIEDSVIDQIRNLYYENATYFSWQKNDLLLVDNVLATHGRQPFEGDRKILVAMV